MNYENLIEDIDYYESQEQDKEFVEWLQALANFIQEIDNEESEAEAREFQDKLNDKFVGQYSKINVL